MDLLDKTLYIGIVGSRRRDTSQDYVLVFAAFSKILIDTHHTSLSHVVIVSGGCPLGADKFAEEMARTHSIRTLIHKPNRESYLDTPEPWRSTKQNYDRNYLIARDARDYLIACVASDRKGGTENTIRHWKTLYCREPILC